jgi:creatinine amidohydrolase
VLERLTEQAIATGFRNVVLMGDHGTGQGPGGVYEAVAEKLDAKYAPRGIHVFHCPQVYAANAAFDVWAKSQGYPVTIHAGLSDTSEMLYLEPDGNWVRKGLLATAVGDPIGEDGKRRIGPDSPRNGVTGDARRSSKALGKRVFDLKVAAAVAEIRSVIPRP